MIPDSRQLSKLRRTKRFRDWLDQYGFVLFYKRKYGRFPRCKTEFPPENKLGRWFNDGIWNAYQKDRLKSWQYDLLKSIGYVFERPNRWKRNLTTLEKGWEEHPESRPYVYYHTPNLKRIERWCTNQRKLHAEGRLCEEKVNKLNRIHFSWDLPSDTVWREYFTKITDWIALRGHMPRRYSPSAQERFYAQWIAKERCKSNKGALSDERAEKITRLCEKAGYHPIKFPWDASYDQYLKWYSKHGKRPRKYSKEPAERRLGAWIVVQNGRMRRGLLSSAGAAKLRRLMATMRYTGLKRGYNG